MTDAKAFILANGPVMLGIDWFEGMYHPDPYGSIRPTGQVVGGHGILAFGADHLAAKQGLVAALDEIVEEAVERRHRELVGSLRH